MPPMPPSAKKNYVERNAWAEAQREIVATTMAEVARLLGCQIEHRESNVFFLTCSAFRLHVLFNDWKNRISISDMIGHPLTEHRISSGSHADPLCHMTVDPDRPADQIATAITRRLLPTYHALHATLLARHQKASAEKDAEMSLARQIAAHGRGQVLDVNPMRPHYSEAIKASMGAGFGKPGPSGTAEISAYRGLHASITLRNVPPELAVYIASLLGEWGGDEEDTP